MKQSFSFLMREMYISNEYDVIMKNGVSYGGNISPFLC